MFEPLSNNCPHFRQGSMTQPGYAMPSTQGMQGTGSAPYMPAPSMGTVMPATIPAYPTGLPTGPATSPMPGPGMQDIMTQAPSSVAPETVADPLYLAGFLRTIVGRRVRVEFLIGTNGTTDRTGVLIGVGASYILLREVEQDDIIVCDLYSIKFVTIIL